MENRSPLSRRGPVCVAPGCWNTASEELDVVPLCVGHAKGVRLALGMRSDAPALTAIVYYLTTDGGATVKVGTTTNPRSRFGSLLQGATGRFEVLAAQPGSYKEESQVHQKLARYGAGRREYFKLAPAVIAHIYNVQQSWPNWREMVEQLDRRVADRLSPSSLFGQVLG